MSISVRVTDGRYQPLVTCDACGKRITDPTMAVVVFDLRGDSDDRAPLFAHKGACDRDVASRRIEEAGGFPGWNEFGTWIANLLHNSGLSGPELEHALRLRPAWGAAPLALPAAVLPRLREALDVLEGS